MNKIRISAVKYANTYPFIYGLTEKGFDRIAILETDHPADCAAKLINGIVDIGLIPVAILPLMKEYHIISNYCIGADGAVKTVLLLSNSPLNDIQTVYLDYRSRSSVMLIKVLAKNAWNKEFVWKDTTEGYDFSDIRLNEAAVLIGDQCFEYEKNFMYKTDLAFEWKKFTGLPFVFACWAANKELDIGFIGKFNEALKSGVDNIEAVVERFGSTGIIKGNILKKYLTENIDFNFNDEKKMALKLFLKLMSEL